MNNIIKSHCNKCQSETKQEIVHSEKFKDTDDEHYVWVENIYEMLKCRGCDAVILKHTEWFSEDYDEHGNPEPAFHFYPPSIFRPEPKWLSELDWSNHEQKFIRELMKEIYSSLHNNTRRLATMGIRALVEHIMIKKVGNQGAFSKNLNSFETQGFISLSQKDILNTVLEAGHATIHRSYSPTTEDLHTCMDITESVVESVYIHPKKAKKLKKKIPKRRRKC